MSKAVIMPVKLGYCVADSETLEPITDEYFEKKAAMNRAFEYNAGRRERPKKAPMEPVEIEVSDPAPAPAPKKRGRPRKKK